MSSFTCEKGCCNWDIVEYKHPPNFRSGPWRDNESSKKIKKAGAFIYDKNTHKILLVQSRGQYWGPPKGSMDPNEDIKSCALREVKEETGIQLEEEILDRFYIVKNKALYYYVEMGEEEMKVQNHIKDNDANGIGWFNLDCLIQLLKDKKVIINQHCKILIRKYLNLDVNLYLGDNK